MGWRNKPRGGKPDKSQAEIVKELKAFGAEVLIVSQIPHSFDLLVFWDGGIYVMEVKNPGPPSTQKLTQGEGKFKDKIEAVGVTYHVVTTPDDAINILMK